MNQYKLLPEHITAFTAHLWAEERSAGTVEKYVRDISAFSVWLADREVSKELTCGWREYLCAAGYAPATVNSMLSALNSFLRFMGWDAFRAKFLRIQRRAFREARRELTKAEYLRLLAAAREGGQRRLALLMETICAAGIRVSEVRYITVEAVRQGCVEIRLKGKIRTILLPRKLCRKLLQYAKTQKTASGEIFLTKSGKSVSRRQIWREMKALCQRAGVEPQKVFPHNLRHLFATTFYQVSRDIVRLADLLGHSSISTTRLYLLTAGTEHIRLLEQLGLVC